VGVDNVAPENAPLSNLNAYYRFDLPDSEFASVVRAAAPAVLIHCAGRASVGLSVSEPAGDFYSNAVVTFEILNALRSVAPKCRFIQLSSAAVYGNPLTNPVCEHQPPAPISPYGFHKMVSEQLCTEFASLYGVPTAAARIFSAYGPGLRRQVLWDVCQKAFAGKEIALQGTGSETRDFVHALDIANALYAIALKAPMEGEPYNVASGREVSIAELAALVVNAVDHGGVVRFDGEVPVGNPLNWRGDIARLRALGFTPSVSLESGVKSFVDWCRAELVGV
jgi:UDP-glucose 4-epimerase